VHPQLSGATFGDIEPSSPYYGQIDGVMIYSVVANSPSSKAGLQNNDIITSVNKEKIKNLEEFKPLVQNNAPLLLNITRNHKAMFLILR